jgi:hypothetical protein
VTNVLDVYNLFPIQRNLPYMQSFLPHMVHTILSTVLLTLGIAFLDKVLETSWKTKILFALGTTKLLVALLAGRGIAP